MFEDWDEGYEPPESATYAGNSDVPVFWDSASKVEPQSGLRELVSEQAERIKDLTGAVTDVSKLLLRQHKMHHGDFITELSGIITAAVLIGKPDTTKDAS